MQSTNTFDRTIIRAVQSVNSHSFGLLMAAATFMGDGVTLTIITVICVIIALSRHAYQIAWAFTISGLLMIAYNAAKLLFHRARPDTPYAAGLHSSSFPSGHSADSMAIYGLIGYLMVTRLPKPYNYLGFVVGIVFPLLVGLSRVYLGAHYPTDVIAGWALASVGLVVLIKVLHI
jgi:undecaprenyl-diphosphatase